VAWKRIKLRFASGVEVTFADRWRALRQVEDFAVGGTWKRFPDHGIPKHF